MLIHFAFVRNKQHQHVLKLLNVKALTQQMTCKLICFQHRQHGPAPVLHSFSSLSLQIQLGLCCFSLHSSNRSRETPLQMSCQCLFLPRQEIRECVCSRRTQQHSHGNASLLSFIPHLCNNETVQLPPALGLGSNQHVHTHFFLFIISFPLSCWPTTLT